MIRFMFQKEGRGHLVPVESVADMAMDMQLRAWKFTKYKNNRSEPAEVIFVNEDPEQSRQNWHKLEPLCQGVIMARELTCEPANRLTPQLFSERCQQLEGVEVQVLDHVALEKMGANGILSVGKGSINKPYIVVMKYTGADPDEKPVAIAGKGVCYDSGGINLKTRELLEMKFDKAGAAAVTGLIYTAALQKAPINLVGVIGLAENMPDGASMKPGDIITMLSGKTVEVVDTDYEGRLILADCLTYAQEMFDPSVVIDLGTLTPEVVGCLADQYAGLYTPDRLLAESLQKAGDRSGERVWHLPMGAYFAKQLESEYADCKNMGVAEFGECAAAAEFLQLFIKPGVRWAHLDIAGVAWTKEGVTGFGVRLLHEWLTNRVSASMQPYVNVR